MSPQSQAQRNVLEENAEAHAKYEAETLERTGGDLNRNATLGNELAANSESARTQPAPPEHEADADDGEGRGDTVASARQPRKSAQTAKKAAAKR